MTNYREILRLKGLGLSHSKIADSLGASRTTVIHALQLAEAQELSYTKAEKLSDRELAVLLYPPGNKPGYKMPDYEYVHREMQKPGVTQQLLWLEYCDQCRDADEIAYGLSQFKKYYHDFVIKNKATMHLEHKPGEQMEVDWAGQTAGITDAATGEIIDASIFVAVLSYSGYAYVEAFLNQKQDAWISAHVNAYAYFGGVTRILVSDNLKTGVLKNTRNELVLNKAYQEMAEHYGTAIIPARPRRPRDKSTGEGTVGNISAFILAALRNQQFFSLKELNEAIKERLYAFNHKPFAKKEGSRATWFKEERSYLLPLSKQAYELAEWKVATVQYNYHISVDGHFYSIPHDYIKQKVDVRLTRQTVEVFVAGTRICSHVRLRGRSGQYSTQEAHMPLSHQQYARWNGERFRQWATKIGQDTLAVIESILSGYKVEQQGYRACMALLKLSDTYSKERLEAACKKALSYTPRPSFKMVQTILKSGQDKIHAESSAEVTVTEFGFTRGSDYYGRGRE